MLDEDINPIQRLTRDLKKASMTLSDDEARFLVDGYYIMQENRKRSDNQILSLTKSGEPHEVILWASTQFRTLENSIKSALDAYSGANPVGIWARRQKGIGPIIAAGLLAHIDIDIAKSAGHIWRYAGLDPTQTWSKGQKRPWNASLKTLCWKIGESFVKVSGDEDALYGQIYKDRKALEVRSNELGNYKEEAARQLKIKKFSPDTDTYKHLIAGHLSPGHIHARAKRYAVKLFLSHYFEVAWKHRWGTEPPKPYSIQHLGHVHAIPYIPVPE